MSNTKIQMKMLDEFQKSFNLIYENYENRNYSYDECKKVLNSLKNVWDSSRMDLKNVGKTSNAVEIIENSRDLSVTFPNWFRNKYGQGCKTETKSEIMSLKLKCVNNGDLNIILRGKDFKILNNVKLPVFVNYTKLLLNDKIIFDEDKLVWHNEPFEYKEFHKNGDIIKLDVEFKQIFDYYPQLKFHLDNINDEADLRLTHNIINNYIRYEKLLIEVKVVEENIRDALANL